MSEFRKYPKIRRIGDSSTDGILDGVVHIEEKLDGANLSIWQEGGEIHIASRNKEITSGFNGAVEYVKNHKGINLLLKEHPEYRLYGEWLVPHTIKSYKETAYKNFYLFDISIFEKMKIVIPTKEDAIEHEMLVMQARKERIAELVALGENEEAMRRGGLAPFTYEDAVNDLTYIESEKSLTGDEVRAIAEAYEINTPEYFGKFENVSEDTIKKEFVGKSNLGPQGEGVVIKNYDFINQWGDPQYAKIVTQEFKEDNATVFGGNNKHSETYQEQYFVNKYSTVARVRKIMQKIQPITDESLSYKHIPRISGTAYHDMIEEEGWAIAQKKSVVDFAQLQRLATKKFIQIYKDILDDNISVADKEK